MKSRIVLTVFLCALTLTACVRSLATYRYRLTVEVETPEGLRSGSSVIEVGLTSVSGFTPEANGLKRSVRGEAVAVDLPGGQTLFALLKGSGWYGPDSFAEQAYEARLNRTLGSSYAKPMTNEIYEARIEALVEQRLAAVLPRSVYHRIETPSHQGAYPLLVRFRDINDPKTVEAVDPDKLAAAFGPGVRLRRITVQITDDPVTVGIEKRLGWWTEYKNRQFDGTPNATEDMTTESLAAHMSSGTFSTEYNK